MILIVASPSDIHGRAVAQHLVAMGLEVAFLDTSRLGLDTSVSYRVLQGGEFPDVKWAARSFELKDISAVWNRRPTAPTINPSVTDPDDRGFAASEWRQLLLGILEATPALFVNPVQSQRSAVKPLQLHIARQVGFRVPDTLITNDRGDVREFLNLHRGRVVHKTLSAPRNFFPETRRWDSAAEAALLDLALAPTILQEEIKGRHDVRVTAVGNELFAAKFESSASRIRSADSRLDLDVPCTSEAIPHPVASGIREFMTRLGLRFGTLDFRVDLNGEYVFLEVNPQGQFLYVEILTGLPICAAVARLLAERLSIAQSDLAPHSSLSEKSSK